MNERIFRRNVLCVIGVYIAAVAIGIVLRLLDTRPDALPYATFKDLVPLIIAIPAAWLGYCFQRRQSYLKDVRELWSKMVLSVQEAVQYTYVDTPTQSDYARTLKGLSVAIEEIRGVFANVGEAERRVGIFPFEGVKDIHKAISRLGFGDAFSRASADGARREIVQLWKRLRRHYLCELERDAPHQPDSPFLE
ncbi:hypothetical protein [Burkholderia ubonensis]|uniref:hypothetical protein n=1 Tax=Burkholderia ubonensis TaxID=101571 RepID=UPI0012F8634A|nr:hypothetical protein [Burkholderia ubonensis]